MLRAARRCVLSGVSAREVRVVVRHPLIHAVGRAGLVAYGLVHGLIAALAVQVAFGDRERVDKKGALTAVATTGFGLAVLWIVAVGMVALVAWQLSESFFAHRGLPRGLRTLRVVINLAEAGLFGTLAWTAVKIAAAGGSPSTGQPFAAVVLGVPGGPVLVALAGIGVLAGAGLAIRRGVRHLFLHELDLRGAGLRRSTLVTRVGQVGWTALGLVYVVPGVLLVAASVHRDPARTGLDAGLQALADEPYGPVLLVLVAVGLVAFGVHCLFDARYRKA
jgi:Domain of Unknown Function (DUF1206)